MSRWDNHQTLEWLPSEPTDLAYLAGIIDGEGWISSRKGSWGDPEARYPMVGIANTDEGLMSWLAEFGGCSYEKKTPGGRRTQRGWQVTARADVRLLLTAILPYMQIKRQKALDALAALGGE